MNALILYDGNSLNFQGINLNKQIHDALEESGMNVNTILLNSDDIKPCQGCFKCWVKTPGLCIITNDVANEIAKEEIRTDILILLSEITYGGFSYDTKAFLDRSIPNILPLFEIYNDEMHHEMRYERFPYWIAIGYGDSTEDEKLIFRELAIRNSLNMRPPKHLALTVQNPSEINTSINLLEKFIREEVCI
jgi:Multimeric flavodoxin WrbA